MTAVIWALRLRRWNPPPETGRTDGAVSIPTPPPKRNRAKNRPSSYQKSSNLSRHCQGPFLQGVQKPPGLKKNKRVTCHDVGVDGTRLRAPGSAFSSSQKTAVTVTTLWAIISSACCMLTGALNRRILHPPVPIRC